MKLNQPFIPPPVELSYEKTVGGQKQTVELPFVTGVFANFSGNDRRGIAPLETRGFIEIDAKHFDKVLASFNPAVVITLPASNAEDAQPSEHIRFHCLEDFLPERINPGQLSLDVVLNDPNFLRLEATWRGLFYLLHAVDASPRTKVKIFDATEEELANSLTGENSLTAQNPLVMKACLEPFVMSGGEPFGCFVGDYYFNQQSVQDTNLLAGLADFSALALAPFIAGASPAILGLNSFQGYVDHEGEALSWDRSDRNAWIAWQALRNADNSRFLGLILPRIKVRESYGRISELLDFIPDLGPDEGITEPCYSNAAFAMAANIQRAFHDDGWPARIRGVESGGKIPQFEHEKQPAAAIAEVTVSDRAEAEFANAGYMPLVRRDGADFSAFVGAQSIGRPVQLDDPDAAADEKISRNMPCVLAVGRFAHYLKCLYRDTPEIGSAPQCLERAFNDWLAKYINTSPKHSSDEITCRKPITVGFTTVRPSDNTPAVLQLRLTMYAFRAMYGMTRNLQVGTLLVRDAASLDDNSQLGVARPYCLVDADTPSKDTEWTGPLALAIFSAAILILILWATW